MVEVGFGSFPFEGVLRIPLGAVNFRSVELVANGEAGRSDEKMQISFYCHIGRYSNLCLTPSESPYTTGVKVTFSPILNIWHKIWPSTGLPMHD